MGADTLAQQLDDLLVKQLELYDEYHAIHTELREQLRIVSGSCLALRSVC